MKSWFPPWTAHPQRVAWAATLGSFALYALGFALISERLGVGYVPLGMIPILVAAWCFGATGGAIAATAMITMGTLLSISAGVGGIETFWSSVTFVRFGIGILIGTLVGRLRDLTLTSQRQQAQLAGDHKRLQNLQLHLADAQAIAGMGSWEADLATRSLQASDELRRILGLDPASKLTFEGALAIVHPDDRDRLMDAFQAALEKPTTINKEIRLLRPDNRSSTVKISARIESSPDNLPLRIRGVAQDVTELRQAEDNRRLAEARQRDVEHLAELNRFKTRFIGAAAHELNTPMTPIVLQLAILNSEDCGPLNAMQRRSIGILQRNIHRLTLLLRDLLDAARLDGQTTRLQYESASLSEIAREALESFEPQAKAAGIRIDSNIQDSPPQWLDARRLSQVLYNLLSNAIKFTPPGGTVRVEATASPNLYRISVSDSGMGLTGEQQQRLFQPFVQVHGDRVVTEGTGLGLYISREFVRLHGGELLVNSKGPGQGSTFEVLLPPIEKGPRQAMARFVELAPRASAAPPNPADAEGDK